MHVPLLREIVRHNVRTPTDYCLWWVFDNGSGKPRRTTDKLTRADAARAFPGAQPHVSSRAIRNRPDPAAAAPASSRPGRHWS